MIIDKLSDMMKKRVIELNQLRKNGKKIVGYFPGGYMPEELVHACGAVPVGLNRGGDHEPVEVSGNYLSRWIYTFGRAHIGYKMLKTEPLYDMVDIFVVPVTDNHVRLVADAWDVFTDVEVFRFGVPHVKHERALQYYLEGLYLLKEKLEKLTGETIDDGKLRESIDLCNRERHLLRKISEMRRAATLPIKSIDFVRLNHASFVLDKKRMVEILESIYEELKDKEGLLRYDIRLMLIGSALAQGDYRILKMIEESGAMVAIEHFSEGMRQYWKTVDVNGDPMKMIAERYFMKRVPPSWFRPGTERQDFVVDLAKDFKVDGVIWYQLMNRESDDFESYWYPEILKTRANLPMLKLASDYDPGEKGAFSTRIETFMEMIRGKNGLQEHAQSLRV